MAALEHTKKQKIITSTLIWSLLAALAVFVGLVIWNASQLSSVTTAIIQHVAIGPLQLIDLQKTPVTDGYEVSLQIQSGIFGYIIAWAVIASVAIWLRLNQSGK